MASKKTDKAPKTPKAPKERKPKGERVKRNWRERQVNTLKSLNTLGTRLQKALGRVDFGTGDPSVPTLIKAIINAGEMLGLRVAGLDADFAPAAPSKKTALEVGSWVKITADRQEAYEVFMIDTDGTGQVTMERGKGQVVVRMTSGQVFQARSKDLYVTAPPAPNGASTGTSASVRM